MTITPLFESRIAAKLIPPDPAEGAITLGFPELDQNPAASSFLATARLLIPSSGSVEFDFRKFNLASLPPRTDAEGREVELAVIRSLAVLSSLPLNVSPGTLPWGNSPLPATLRCLSHTGALDLSESSRSIILANPSPTSIAELTIIAIGENYAIPGGAFFIGGVPLVIGSAFITFNPS